MIEPADRECPTCGVLAGKPCLTPAGKIANRIHASRVHGVLRPWNARRGSKKNPQQANNL